MREFNQQRLIRHLLKGNGGLQMIQALLIFMPGDLSLVGCFFCVCLQIKSNQMLVPINQE
jgi:hypothetical protein